MAMGLLLLGTDVRIVDDGEILIKGFGVMQGYYNLSEATAVSLQDGWFATGDLGELDDLGYLKIMDRKKDLIKIFGGKYVAPQKVEGTLKVVSFYLSQVIVHGESRKYVIVLLTLDQDAIVEWGSVVGLEISLYESFVSFVFVWDLIDGYIAQANKQLERWETIKKFAILPAELTVDEGEVIFSQKVRRRAVEKKYVEVLDSLYDKD